VPKATPDSVVKIIHEATLEALKSPAVREKIENQAGRVFTAGPADLDAIVTKDIRALSKIVKERGIKPE
jgi:tripartite-type tricarboxylate transporter receptor subunit TctC